MEHPKNSLCASQGVFWFVCLLKFMLPGGNIKIVCIEEKGYNEKYPYINTLQVFIA